MINALCRLTLTLLLTALPSISVGGDDPLLRPVIDPSAVAFRQIDEIKPPLYTRHRFVTVHPDELWNTLESAQDASDLSEFELLVFRIFDDAVFHTQIHAVRLEYWDAHVTLTVVDPNTLRPIEPFGIVDLALTRGGKLRLGIRLENQHYHVMPADELPTHIVVEKDVEYLPDLD